MNSTSLLITGILLASGAFFAGNMVSQTDYTTEVKKQIVINKSIISNNDQFLKENCQPKMLENQKIKDENGRLSDLVWAKKETLCRDIHTKALAGDKYTGYEAEYTWVEWCDLWIVKDKWCFVNTKYNCVSK